MLTHLAQEGALVEVLQHIDALSHARLLHMLG
jgi:hypothetical protein